LADGHFGHTIDLRSQDELGDLANTFNQMSTQLERLYRERAESERIQREIEIARSVQQALFPAQLPRVAGLEMAAVCRPHRETSGDFYDVLELEDGQLGIVVGDVSGKSIPAAMLMVAAHSAILSEAYDHDSPAEVLDESNTMLCRDVPRGMFVAASYARLNAQKREMVWANAGQIYPFLLHRVRPADLQDYPHYLEVTGASWPLGMDAAVKYDDQHLTLLPGDTVLFYTDGVVEAMNPARELYGFERLESLVRSLQPGISSQALIDAVLADVAAFVGPAEQHDDITMVAIRFVGEPA
jgi:sigma-B regulation protein RsbU (phosphoserine phosphatase)